MSSVTSSRHSALEGLRAMAPIILGMAPFGVVAGIAAVEAGVGVLGAAAFSTVVFAGAAQLAALDLLGDGANPLVIIGTIAVINARFLMYAASLAPHFAGEPLARRAAMAYLLTDQAYAVTITRLDDDPPLSQRWAFYMGGAAALWAGWQVYTVLGAAAGAVVPAELPLGFAIPLVFAALLVPAVTDRPTLAAAVVSALVAVLAGGLPANIGLLLAAASGIAAGLAVSLTRTRSVTHT